MSTIAENLAHVRAEIERAARQAGRDPGEITLVAATKTQTSDTIRAAIAAGVTDCGENRVQELTAHLADHAYDGARVHFIGHLQTNKVKFVVGKVDLIHSVSSEKLLLAIDKQAEKLGIVQDILLEVNLAGEESKSGFAPEEVPSAAALAGELNHVRLRGLMCIPPAAKKIGENRPFFAKLRGLAVDMSGKMGDNVADVVCLSMGMSGDYLDAVAEGATYIRLGTALFGPRPPIRPVDTQY
jgi:hypothetical protein